MTRDERNTIIKSFQSGTTHISSTGAFHLQCDFDVSLFPFDRQFCVVRIDTNGYVIEMQKLVASNLYLQNFTKNEQWDVGFHFKQERNLTYPSGRTYSIVEFAFFMRRKSTFYGVSLLVPLVTSSIIELATFAFAVDDSNRLQLSFTCFLSFTFLISMLTEKLPENSESMPLLLIAVCVTSASVCGVIAFHLTTSPKYITQLNKSKCYRVAQIIDKFAISFYVTIILLTELVLPLYMFLSN